MYHERLSFYNGLMARLDGPLHLRFIFQPAMAIFLGVRDGIADARKGEPAYFWTIIRRLRGCGRALEAGLKSVGKVLVIAFLLDAIYQAIVFRDFHLIGAIDAALLLAFIPYVLIRGPANRMARWWWAHPRRAPGQGARPGAL